MKKRLGLIILISACALLLAGFGSRSVELASDTKLIDLDKAIDLCLPGGDSYTDTEYKDESINNDNESALQPDGSPFNGPRTVAIRVRGETVTYNSSVFTDMSKLKERIRQDDGGKTTFKLTDDYAEAHVYREVLGILTELHSQTGLVFIEE